MFFFTSSYKYTAMANNLNQQLNDNIYKYGHRGEDKR